jgi:hypothetical protein
VLLRCVNGVRLGLFVTMQERRNKPQSGYLLLSEVSNRVSPERGWQNYRCHCALWRHSSELNCIQMRVPASCFVAPHQLKSFEWEISLHEGQNGYGKAFIWISEEKNIRSLPGLLPLTGFRTGFHISRRKWLTADDSTSYTLLIRFGRRIHRLGSTKY